MSRARASAARWPVAAAVLWLAGCASPPALLPPERTPAPPPAAAVPSHGAEGRVLARNERLLVYVPSAADTFAGIAARFLGDAGLGWTIAEANESRLERGAPLVVPLKPLNPLGVHADRVQTVPILCYHRFGTPASKMVVTPAAFEAQLDWLARNGYHVLRLADLTAFLEGRQPLPRRSVVITIDDGYESVYRHAYPLLKRYAFPATIFVYTDFLGAGDALTWSQLNEMAASGLVDVQSHSKTHRNLIERRPSENDERYRAAIEQEMRTPREALEKRLPNQRVRFVAYPFGDANDTVLESAARHGYELGATVHPGGNAFYAQPLMLRRTMIFGDLGLEGFKAKLQTSRPLALP